MLKSRTLVLDFYSPLRVNSCLQRNSSPQAQHEQEYHLVVPMLHESLYLEGLAVSRALLYLIVHSEICHWSSSDGWHLVPKWRIYTPRMVWPLASALLRFICRSFSWYPRTLKLQIFFLCANCGTWLLHENDPARYLSKRSQNGPMGPSLNDHNTLIVYPQQRVSNYFCEGNLPGHILRATARETPLNRKYFAPPYVPTLWTKTNARKGRKTSKTPTYNVRRLAVSHLGPTYYAIGPMKKASRIC